MFLISGYSALDSMKFTRLASFELTPTKEGLRAERLPCIFIGSANSVFLRSKFSMLITGVAIIEVINESILLILESYLLNIGPPGGLVGCSGD